MSAPKIDVTQWRERAAALKPRSGVFIDGRFVPAASGEQYARALPRSRLVVVEGAGHLVDMEQPEALAKLIVQFVAQA